MGKRGKKEIIYAFIDSQNLNLGVLSQGWKLDFKRFRVYLDDKYDVSRAFLFIGFISTNERLYKYLKNANYELVFKPIIKFNCNKKEKIKGNVDSELVLHTMIHFNDFDKAIIVTGDGDFYCLLKYLHDNGKLLRIIVPNKKSFSRLLWRLHQYIDYLDKQKNKLGAKKMGV